MMISKECTKCNELKILEDFYTDKRCKDGRITICKVCIKKSINPETNANKTKKWREENPEKAKEMFKKHYQNNKETIIQKNKLYRKINADIIRERRKIYRENNSTVIQSYRENNAEIIRKKTKKYVDTRRKLDPLYKLTGDIRTMIGSALRKHNFSKDTNTYNILGCSFEELKAHLERQFEDWMTWENRGKYKKGEFNYGWDIDHIKPLSSAITENDIIKLNHYTNLKPLCSNYNRYIKKDRY